MEKIKKIGKLIMLLLIVPVIMLAFQSCGGCGGCCSASGNATINVGSSSKSGSLSVNILGIPKPKTGTNYLSITVSGIQINDVGGTGRTSFSDAKTYEVTANNINPAPLITKEALKPGRWPVVKGG